MQEARRDGTWCGSLEVVTHSPTVCQGQKRWKGIPGREDGAQKSLGGFGMVRSAEMEKNERGWGGEKGREADQEQPWKLG